MARSPTSTPSRLYRGVRLEPDGRWAAYVSEGEREGHLLGYFRHEAHAALAHDRAAVFLGAPLVHGHINFPPSFSDMELLFLRRCCTEDFFGPRRADDDYAYNMAFEDLLAGEFEKYVCGDATEETVRAIEAYAAREGPAWHAHNPQENDHMFVFGHISPALCSSWVELFHHGDPNWSYFTCEEAHEWKAARSRDFEVTIKREDQKVVAAPPAVVLPSRDDLTHTAERGAEEPSPHSSSAKPGLASTPWRSLERWLSSWTCFDTDNQTKDELHVPLWPSTTRVVQPKRQKTQAV